MKTHREVLLARHQTVEPKLDTLREQVIATLNEPLHEQPSWFERLVDESRNLFRVPRFAWSGLAAAWLVVVALHFAARDSAPRQPVVYAQKQPPAETLQAVREQKRLLAELTGLVEKPESEPPRIVPRPRTERQYELIMV
jgi:hypothetical protein